MRFSALTFALLFSALSITTAAPAADLGDLDARAVDPESRDIITIGLAGYAYDKFDQQGTRWALTPGKRCHGLWGLTQNDKFSSIQIGEGIECKFYRNFLCRKKLPFKQGGELVRTGPFEGDIPSNWNNQISGYRCNRLS